MGNEKRAKSEVDSMVKKNKGLVYAVAKKFAVGHHNQYDDYIQAGFVGLIEAAQRYEAIDGATFGTYAYRWIFRRMIELTIASRSVKVVRTRTGRKMFTRFAKARAKLEALGLEVTPEALAKEMDCPAKDVAELMPLMENHDVYLEDKVSHSMNDSTRTIEDTLVANTLDPIDAIQAKQIDRKLAFVLKSIPLDEREGAILLHRVMADEPESLKSLATKYGVTKQRMSQVEIKLLDRIAREVRRTLEA